jgi:CubicO group peptidase (beta-lactamase class C family)
MLFVTIHTKYNKGQDDGAAHHWPGGVDFFPNVTARHLLSQSSGYGRVAPGTFFSYDSFGYIQHLSDALAKATAEPAVAWATREFAEKLGLPELFLSDGVAGGGVSAGGGQLMTCRDLARVGTLLVNGGRWADAAGEEYDLLSADYARQQLSPSYPDFNAGYGFLTWLNTNVTAWGRGESHCCAPRWGGARRCTPDNATCGGCCTARGGPGASGGVPKVKFTGLTQNSQVDSAV